jgi:hypothetical protein
MTAAVPLPSAASSLPAAPSPPPPGRPTFRVRPAPRREPPFDDELPARVLRLVGPLDQPLPFAEPPARRLGHAADAFAPQLTGRGELPDARAFGRRLLVAITEAMSGRRTLHQLAAHLSQSVYSGLVSDLGRADRARAWRGQVTIRSVRVSEPADGVAELSAVVRTGNRYRAVAARLEGLDGRWRCVRLQLG